MESNGRCSNGMKDVVAHVNGHVDKKDDHTDETRLCQVHEAPTYANVPFVMAGYRSSLSFHGSLKSIFTWHNETLNIWSHLLGFLNMFAFIVYDNTVIIPAFGGDYIDHIIDVVSLLCFSAAFFGSTGYHIFMCHSEESCKKWLAIDMAGIWIGSIGIYLSGIYYAFYCLKTLQFVHLSLVAVLSVAMMKSQLGHKDMLQAFDGHKNLVIGFLSYGSVPAGHAAYLGWSSEDGLLTRYVIDVITYSLILWLALGIYYLRLPERYFPGKFDCIGRSHLWWHLMMYSATLWWHHAWIEMFKHRRTFGCAYRTVYV